MSGGLRLWRFVLLAALPLLAMPAHAGSSGEARAWIKRMNSALATNNYDGVFAYEMGKRRAVIHIIHAVRDGRMTERLVYTDASRCEIVRNGSEWTAYFPESKVARVEVRNRSWGFMVTLNGLNEESDRYYEIGTGGAAEIMGRPARLIRIEPRDAARYGYRFWLDQETAMPLKTQLVSRSGEVVEQIEFVTLNLPPSIPDALLRPEVDTTGFTWWRVPSETHNPEMKIALAPRADLLPAGFRVRVSKNAEEETRTRGPRTRFIVSDGIAWVSVFVEPPGEKEKDTRAAASASAARADSVTSMGSTSIHVVRMKGFKVTVVGEVPPSTAQAIAEAVRPE